MDPEHRKVNTNILNALNSRSVHHFNLSHYHRALFSKNLSVKKKVKGDIFNSTLSWNYNGSLLMSGGHDMLKIWSYPEGVLLHDFSTGVDTHGIMSAKFIDDIPDRVVTGSGNGKVQLFDINQNYRQLASFPCHFATVKGVAVVNGNPHIVWSGGKDGTVRKHDLREVSQCGANCKVQLDLRNAHLNSLEDKPNGLYRITSLAINPMRPNFILVGGTDSFARLYDIRNKHVEYYCPKHLSKSAGHRILKGKEITYVTFKADGTEALINYFGDHLYLIDIVAETLVRAEEYDWASISGMTKVSYYNHFDARAGGDADLNSTFKKVREDLKKKVRELTPYKAIELLSYLTPPYPKTFETYERLCSRASLFMKRDWFKDLHMAIRDLYAARDLGHSDYKIYHTLAEVLWKMDDPSALEFAEFAKILDPTNSEIQELLNNIRRGVETMNYMRRDYLRREVDRLKDEWKAECSAAASKVINSDEGGSSEESDLEDYYESGEDYEFGEEGEDYEFGEETEENCVANNDPLNKAFDVTQCFAGHINYGIHTKEANFIGKEGEYIACGSDDGMLYIYEKGSGKLMSRYLSHNYAVTCCQSHPTELAIATSGLGTISRKDAEAVKTAARTGGVMGPNNEYVEDFVKIWTPDVTDHNPLTQTDLDGMEENQRRLRIGYWHDLPLGMSSLIRGGRLD